VTLVLILGYTKSRVGQVWRVDRVEQVQS